MKSKTIHGVVRVTVPTERLFTYSYVDVELRKQEGQVNPQWVWRVSDHAMGTCRINGRSKAEAIRKAKALWNEGKFMFFLQT